MKNNKIEEARMKLEEAQRELSCAQEEAAREAATQEVLKRVYSYPNSFAAPKWAELSNKDLIILIKHLYRRIDTLDEQRFTGIKALEYGQDTYYKGYLNGRFIIEDESIAKVLSRINRVKIEATRERTLTQEEIQSRVAKEKEGEEW